MSQLYDRVGSARIESLVWLAFLIMIGACANKDVQPSQAVNNQPAASGPLSRTTTDMPDNNSREYQVKIVYALPSDGIDRALDTDGTIGRSVGSFQQWLDAQSGGKRFRVDTFRGRLDILFFRMSQTDAAISATGPSVRDEIEKEIRAASFFNPMKLYAVYYDGRSTYACGGGAWPPKLPGHVAALYLQGAPRGDPPCSPIQFAPSESQPRYWEFSMIHEIFHSLGIVAPCAPNHVLDGHVWDDPKDLMYKGVEPWSPSKLDTNRDDYFTHGKQCLDLANSVFITPTGPGAMPPPSW